MNDIPCIEHKLNVSTMRIVDARADGRIIVTAMCTCRNEDCAWTTTAHGPDWTSTKWPSVREVTR